MIYKLSGTVIAKEVGKVAVELSNGIAYEMNLSVNSYLKTPDIGNSAELFTHFAVSENSMALYGFISMEEKTLFLKLIKVDRIGPKAALSILSSMDTESFCAAIASGDVLKLSKAPGIGKKTAERLIVELKDKIVIVNSECPIVSSNIKGDVVSALCNLGYKMSECEKVVSQLPDAEFDVMFKAALKKFSA